MQMAWYPHVRIFQQKAENLHMEPTKYKEGKIWLRDRLKDVLIINHIMPEAKLQMWERGGLQAVISLQLFSELPHSASSAFL